MDPKNLPTIRLATVDEIISLRSAVLRDGPLLHFTADNADGTLHGGAFLDHVCIATATFLRERLDEQDAYRLRGMAVDEAHQRKGIGRALLEFLVLRASEEGVRFFWCNARAPAVPFYKRLGWQIVNESFDIPEAGLHYRMTYHIRQA